MKRLWLIPTFLFFQCFVPSVKAQDTGTGMVISKGEPGIRWVDQFPSPEKLADERNMTTRLFDLLAGRKNKVKLSKPVSVVADYPEKFWILDQGNGATFQVNKKVGEIPHFWKKNSEEFKSLVWLARFSENRFLFTDSYLNKIFVADPSGKTLTPLNDSLLGQPTGISWSPLTRQIWVVETKAHQIRIMDEYGRTVRIIGKRGNGPSEFNFPTSICIDKEGTAFVVDAMNFRIQVFSKDGSLISIFGEAGDATGYLARPKGIATDSQGNIYIADALFHTVQIFDKAGRFLYKFGSQGRGQGEFWMPSGVFIDDHDYIYVADTYNSRVQVFQLISGGIK